MPKVSPERETMKGLVDAGAPRWKPLKITRRHTVYLDTGQPLQPWGMKDLYCNNVISGLRFGVSAPPDPDWKPGPCEVDNEPCYAFLCEVIDARLVLEPLELLSVEGNKLVVKPTGKKEVVRS